LKQSLTSDIKRLQTEFKIAENNLTSFKGNNADKDLIDFETRKQDSLQKLREKYELSLKELENGNK
jgi:hypothetical protein